MKESNFIQQNKEHWKQYEEVLKGRAAEPDALHDLYVQVTDDLSYARTHYPNRSVRVYLNHLARLIFLKLYTNKKTRRRFLMYFFKRDLPYIMYTSRRELLATTLLFVMTFSIGVFSSRQEPSFGRQILGSRYVEMTEHNIKQGKPMDVYTKGDRLTMFLRIAYNNLRVDVLTFATGLILAIGSLFVLSYNGIMVGAFQYLFYGSGFFTFSVFTIWLHGTLEIFTMILSATAGLVLGKGLIYPESYPRFQAFRRSSLKGVKIMLAVIPLTLTAAFIETYLTGQTQAPLILKASLILISLLFIVYYFVWYPYIRYRNGAREEPSEHRLVRSPLQVNLNEIKTSGELITETFNMLRSGIKRYISMAFAMSVLWVFGYYLLEEQVPDYTFIGLPSPAFEVIKLLSIGQWFDSGDLIHWYGYLAVLCLCLSFFIRHFYRSEILQPAVPKIHISRLLFVLPVMMLALWPFYYTRGFWNHLIYLFFVFPFALFLANNLMLEGWKGLSGNFLYFFKSLRQVIVVNLSLLLLSLILFLIVTSPVFNFIIEAVFTGLKMQDKTALKIESLLVQIFGLTVLFTSTALYLCGNTLLFHSAKEKNTATSLKNSLKKLWQ